MSWKLGAIALLVLGLVPAKGAQKSPPSEAATIHALLAKGDYEGADRIYANELAEHPGDFNLLYNRGLANYLAGHFEKSRDLLLSVAPADRNNLKYQELLAAVLIKLGDYPAAVSAYQAAVKLAPSDPDDLLRLGAVYLRLKLGQHATEVYTRGRRLFPRRPEFLLGLGVVQEMQAKFDSAIEIYRRVAEEYPQYQGGYLFLAHAELKSGKIEEAKKVATRLVAMNSGSALGQLYLAEASWRTPGDADQAKHHLDRALQLNPQLPEALVLAARMDLKNRRPQQAIHSLQAAIGRQPRMAEAYYVLMRAYSQLGEKEKADAALETFNRLKKTESQDNPMLATLGEGSR